MRFLIEALIVIVGTGILFGFVILCMVVIPAVIASIVDSLFP